MLVDSLLQLAIGRVVLACLPPGWPGYGDRVELGATLTASFVLGALALGLLPWWWVWALVFVLRVATLPGALRPRHARPVEWGVAHALILLAWIVGRSLGYERGFEFILPAAWLLTAAPVWRSSADRRVRALGVLAFATIAVEVIS